MKCRGLVTAIFTLIVFAAAQGQSTQPHFAVVSIRVDPPISRAFKPAGPVRPGGKYVDEHATLWSLIVFAYPRFSFPEKTLVGLPKWAYGGPGSVFDLEAVPATGTSPTMVEMRNMMGAALADRFHFRFHLENREMPVLFLHTAHGGTHGIKTSAPGDESLLLVFGPGITGRGATMDEFAAKLGVYFEAVPVLNRTGLTGFYDIDAAAPPGGPPMGRGGQQTMILRQLKMLGLGLAPGRASVPVMVVDSVTRPTAN